MLTSVVHAYILAYHTTACFALSLIFPFFCVFNFSPEQIELSLLFRHITGFKIVNKIFIIGKYAFHKLSVNTPIVFYTVAFQIYLFGTTCERKFVLVIWESEVY